MIVKFLILRHVTITPSSEYTIFGIDAIFFFLPIGYLLVLHKQIQKLKI